MIPPNPRQFDEKRFSRRLQALGALLNGFVQLNHSRFDGIQEPLLPLLGLLQLPVQLIDPGLLIVLRALEPLAQAGDHRLQALGSTYPVCQPGQYELVQCFHSNVAASAGVITAILPARALVVAIPPALAGYQRHAAAALAADQQAGEQGRG